MRIAIVGHRGSGKTSFAKRIAKYRKLKFYDLDALIADDIAAYFEEYGEAEFRKEEVRVFKKLCEQESHFVCSLGAGYIGDMPNDVHTIWFRRKTDEIGRIFLDRPRLNKEMPPLEEYFLRKQQRDPRFTAIYDEIVDAPEGFDFPNPKEEDFFQTNFDYRGCLVSLKSEHFAKANRLKAFEDFYQNNKNLRIELRDDLLNDEQIRYALKVFPAKDLLLSFRKKENPIFVDYLKQKTDCRWDWAGELGKAKFTNQYDVYSLHDDSLSEAIKKMQCISAKEYKLSPLVNTLKEIEAGDQWLRAQNRASFLPRSKDGRYLWYRLHSFSRQSLFFLASGSAPIQDQASALCFAYYQSTNSSSTFAGVLGYPISHSLSVAEHFDFFQKAGLPFYNIPIEDYAEVDILIRLGLKYAAITSPLKKAAYESANIRDASTQNLFSANTLVVEDQQRHVWNTDTEAIRDLPQVDVVWGGSALVPALKAQLPDAAAYSARTGEPKAGDCEAKEPKKLLWAVGRQHYRHPANAKWPPKTWQVQEIIDLNYTEDSPGKEYAQEVGARYTSGLDFFKKQAKKQQEIWSRYVGK
tara:strand:- start:744 stop:2483 length:1740 start_codon:yes stop_codon:yes gene_type:complete